MAKLHVTRTHRGALLLSLTLLFLAPLAGASERRVAMALQDGAPRVHASLVVHPDDADRARVRAGVLLEIAPGWHVYGAEAGETGLPTEVQWLAEGGEVRGERWPATVPFANTEVGYEGMGYEGQVLLPATVTFDAQPGQIEAGVSLLACKDECIPAEARLVRAPPSFAVGASADREAFSLASTSAGTGAAMALWLAFLGGLLLNLMPCVLPVLAIKALALTELAESGDREARRQSLAYAGGVALSLLALAAAVFALRAGGAVIGWGFQFQEPLYVAALGAVLVLFALNLFGVYEILPPSGRLAALGAEATGTRRSFFDGLLTVALATPCSAPFLGTAVGFALAEDAAWIFPIFLAIAAGLALPLTLVGFVPRAARWLPRPGPWMQELRVLLGFVLLATVTWLAWVIGRQSGIDVTARFLAWLLAVAFLAWRFGVRQRAGNAAPAWLAATAAALVLVGGIGAVHTRPDSAAAPALPDVREWSRNDVATALRIGRPAFVYFTADWCITCKANERLVLPDDRIHEALRAGGFEVFEGDWTERDTAITRELSRHGRSGVPFYAVHAPGRAPEILPELLSVESVLEALVRADRAATVSRVTRAAHAGSMQ